MAVSLILPLISIALIAFLLVIVFWQYHRLESIKAERADTKEEESFSLVQSSQQVGSDALFATLSHELRTPLNGLLGVVQMLNEERDDEDLLAIEGCARHILAVVSTLVNHSKIQADKDNLPEYREWGQSLRIT